MCPVGGGLLPEIIPGRMICRCLLVETAHRLILVDTGLGLSDVSRPRISVNHRLLGFRLLEEETALRQVRRLGYSPEDVTDVIVTHLDLDHAGGIPDFPWARIHVQEKELHVARTSRHWKHRQRYLPSHFPESARWNTFRLDQGESWMGFQRVREFGGLPPEILLVDLPGHSSGHTGVLVETNSGESILHAGDAYYDRRSLLWGVGPSLGIHAFERLVHEDWTGARRTAVKLSELAFRRPDIRIVCSHDPNESPLL